MVLLLYGHLCIIGVSLSEPHLAELLDEMSVCMYIRMYVYLCRAVNHLRSYCAYSCIMC